MNLLIGLCFYCCSESLDEGIADALLHIRPHISFTLLAVMDVGIAVEGVEPQKQNEEEREYETDYDKLQQSFEETHYNFIF